MIPYHTVPFNDLSSRVGQIIGKCRWRCCSSAPTFLHLWWMQQTDKTNKRKKLKRRTNKQTSQQNTKHFPAPLMNATNRQKLQTISTDGRRINSQTKWKTNNWCKQKDIQTVRQTYKQSGKQTNKQTIERNWINAVSCISFFLYLFCIRN